MSNEIKTTMTLDQQSMLRELQRQNVALLKNADAFMEVAKAGLKSGQAVKTGMALSEGSIVKLGASVAGFGTLAQGITTAVQSSLRLVAAEHEKLNQRANEALVSVRTPANAYRKLYANAPPERRDQLQQEVEQISQKTGARFETVAPVLGGAYSSLANLDPKYAGEATSIALRWFPDDPQAAEEIASRSLGLMSAEKQQGREVNPEQIIGSLFEMMQASMIRSAEQTFKSGMPGVAALAQSGMSVRKAEGFFAGMTNLNQDLTGERTKSTLQNLPSGMRTFSPETDQHRRERIRAEYLEALDVVDTRPKRRDELVRQLDDRHITDPEQLAPVAAGMLRQQAELYSPGSDKRRRLEEKTALVEKSGTHLLGRDPQGQDVHVPVAQYREFQKAADIEEKLRVAGKHRELGQSLLSHLSINATSEEALTRLIEGDKARWSVIDAAQDKIHDADHRSAARLRSELAKLEGNRLIVMSGAQRRLEQSVQKVELKSPLDQGYGLAKQTMESAQKKLPTGVIRNWIETTGMPIVNEAKAQDDPYAVMIPRLEAELQRFEADLAEGKPDGLQSGPKAKVFGLPVHGPLVPYQGDERSQREAHIEFIRELIGNLRRTKAEMTPKDGVVAPVDDRVRREMNPPNPVKVPPQSGPGPVRAIAPQDRFRGARGVEVIERPREVGLITQPIKQRLRPDIDFALADTGGDIARQMQVARRPAADETRDLESEDDEWLTPADQQRKRAAIRLREQREDDEFRQQRSQEEDVAVQGDHQRLVTQEQWRQHDAMMPEVVQRVQQMPEPIAAQMPREFQQAQGAADSYFEALLADPEAVMRADAEMAAQWQPEGVQFDPSRDVLAEQSALVSRRTPQERIRGDVIDRALTTAESEKIPGVSREGLQKTAEQWGDDTTGFAGFVSSHFRDIATQRGEQQEPIIERVPLPDGSFEETETFERDPSVGRLMKAANEIYDAPIRELKRTPQAMVKLDMEQQAAAVQRVAVQPSVTAVAAVPSAAGMEFPNAVKRVPRTAATAVAQVPAVTSAEAQLLPQGGDELEVADEEADSQPGGPASPVQRVAGPAMFLPRNVAPPFSVKAAESWARVQSQKNEPQPVAMSAQAQKAWDAVRVKKAGGPNSELSDMPGIVKAPP